MDRYTYVCYVLVDIYILRIRKHNAHGDKCDAATFFQLFCLNRLLESNHLAYHKSQWMMIEEQYYKNKFNFAYNKVFPLCFPFEEVRFIE